MCICRIPREPGDGGCVLAFLGLMALDWDLEGCLDTCRWRREVKGVPNIEIEAACDRGRGRLVEESLLGKRLLKGKFGLPMVKGVECLSQELGFFSYRRGEPSMILSTREPQSEPCLIESSFCHHYTGMCPCDTDVQWTEGWGLPLPSHILTQGASVWPSL